MKSYIIYMHKNKINNKVYIGKTCQTFKERCGSNGIGYRNCIAFYNAIKTYGWDNFDHIVLFTGLNSEEAKEKERELIKQYKSRNTRYGYNIRVGGEGMEPEDSLALWENPDYVERIRTANIKNWQNKEYKDTMKKKMKESWLDPERRAKRSEAATERWKDPDFRSKTVKSIFESCAKPIKCIETNIVYESIKDACDKLNLAHGNAHRAIIHGYKWGGYHWEYINVS
jgi:group I intron endonuclease